MKLVYIFSDEWYPVWDFMPVDKPSDNTCEIPEDLYNRWEKMQEDFNVLQTEISKYYKSKNWKD